MTEEIYNPEINYYDFNDYELELIREIAAQIYGYVESDMWGKLTREKPIVDLDYYKEISEAETPNELNNMEMQGGGWKSALRHVLSIGSSIAKGIGKGSNYLSENPELLKNIPLLGAFDPSIYKVVSKVANPVSDVLDFGKKLVPKEKKKKQMNYDTYGQIEAPDGNEQAKINNLYNTSNSLKENIFARPNTSAKRTLIGL